MKSESNKPFLILNASAGSGKTFNLVRNYLRLLLSEGESRAEMSQIIAMTFTNKAALEMKTRIVSDLNKLSNAPNDLPFLVDTAAYIGLSTEKVQKNARLTLKKILHQYEDFNVLTIDKFNLRLIRSFSRDLNLPEQFEVVLDEDLILEKAVDELLNTIDKNEQNSLYQLAINYAKSNFDEENKWNVKKALLASAAILKNEQSFATIRKLTASSFTENDLKAWKETVKLLKIQLQQLLRNVSEALQTSGLSPEDFSNKSKTYNTLLKEYQSRNVVQK
jgi:ATP-dependent exoDNAse (exonuclease V) beta subunit